MKIVYTKNKVFYQILVLVKIAAVQPYGSKAAFFIALLKNSTHKPKHDNPSFMFRSVFAAGTKLTTDKCILFKWLWVLVMVLRYAARLMMPKNYKKQKTIYKSEK